MHQVFAAIRLWQLANVQALPHHADFHGNRIFGSRWEEGIREFILNSDVDEPRESLINLSYNVLHTTGFYDDDRDTVRTLTNMESATITYVDEQLKTMDQWPIYVEDKEDPTSTIGIELTIDAILHYSNHKRIRYIGTADAVLQCVLDREQASRRETYLGENKTASRLDDSWRFSFEMSHQVTGYNVLATTLLKKPTFKSKVFGLRLQPGKQDTYESFEPQERSGVMVQKWAEWVYGGVELYDMYDGDYENAKRLTHSCNRYFRPCALLPFCSDSPEGRDLQIEQMVAGEMSPSEQAVQLGVGV